MLTHTLLSFLLASLPMPSLQPTLNPQTGQLQLCWRQQSETADANYRIEQALPGQPWQTVAQADAVGWPGQTANYSYALAPAPTGTRYRLGQRQADGRMHYSPIVTLPATPPPAPTGGYLPSRLPGQAEAAGAAGALGCYPNPASAAESLFLLGVDPAAGPVRVLSLQGQVLADLPPVAGPHQLLLPAGVYQLQQGLRSTPLIFK